MYVRYDIQCIQMNQSGIDARGNKNPPKSKNNYNYKARTLENISVKLRHSKLLTTLSAGVVAWTMGRLLDVEPMKRLYPVIIVHEKV